MNTAESRIIESRPLVDIVRERLIEDIIGKRFQPGEKLPVVDIATRYGVSETPVKQAFNRLISEGMLAAEPRRGVRVRSFSAQDLRELMEARHMVHLYSVDAVITELRDPDSETARRIERNLQRHREVLEGLHGELSFTHFLTYFRVEREYHRTYLECLSNTIIEKIFDQLYNQAYIYLTLSDVMAQRIERAYRDHAAVYDAYREGDRGRVVDLLNRHKEGAVVTMNRLFLEGSP